MDESIELYDEPEDLTKQTVIQNRYAFWYHKRGGKSQAVNYEETMKMIATFQTVEHFWRIYNHLVRPSDMKSTTDFHLFKDGIKPTWEDPQNQAGGKWMVRLKKGLASMVWEEVVLAVIGEQFDVGHEICGAVCSVRSGEDIISIWNKTADNQEATNKIRDHMRRIINLPAHVQIEYKKHQDSLVDKSSFRNPSLVWKPKDVPAQRQGGYHKDYQNRDGQHRDGQHRDGQHRDGGHYNKEGTHREGGGGGYNKDHAPRDKAGNSWNRDNNGGGGGGDGGWSSRPAKKRDDHVGTAAASAADWINKRPTNKGDKQGESENVWARRTASD